LLSTFNSRNTKSYNTTCESFNSNHRFLTKCFGNILLELNWLSSWYSQSVSTQLQCTFSKSYTKQGKTNSQSFKGNHCSFTKHFAILAFWINVWKLTLSFRMFATKWCNAVQIDRCTNHFVWFTDTKVIGQFGSDTSFSKAKHLINHWWLLMKRSWFVHYCQCLLLSQLYCICVDIDRDIQLMNPYVQNTSFCKACVQTTMITFETYTTCSSLLDIYAVKSKFQLR
jgi:hypothetical protein